MHDTHAVEFLSMSFWVKFHHKISLTADTSVGPGCPKWRVSNTCFFDSSANNNLSPTDSNTNITEDLMITLLDWPRTRLIQVFQAKVLGFVKKLELKVLTFKKFESSFYVLNFPIPSSKQIRFFLCIPRLLWINYMVCLHAMKCFLLYLIPALGWLANCLPISLPRFLWYRTRFLGLSLFL